MTIEQFIAGFMGASTIEIVASSAGFICVYLLIKRNIWNFFFGFIQVSLFSWVFFSAKLYSDAMLHLLYIGLQVYGWWNWSHHKDQQAELIVVRTRAKDVAIWAGVCLLGALILGTLMDTYTDASFAYPDAFTTSTSIVAQFLLTRRHLLNWMFWIVVDIVAIGIYLQKGLYPTSLLYLVFLIMCCFGQYSWWKHWKQQPEDDEKSQAGSLA